MLRRWLTHPLYGNSFLYGLEKHTWDETYEHDFVAIPKPTREADKDLLSRLLFGPFTDHYHNVVGRFYKVRTV